MPLRRSILILAASTGLCLAAPAAHAAVVYVWQQLGASPTIASSSGRLELDPSAGAAGAFSWGTPEAPGILCNGTGCGVGQRPAAPGADIVAFDFAINGSAVLGFETRGGAPLRGGALLEVVMNGVGGGRLESGFLDARFFDTGTRVSMSGRDGVWTVLTARSGDPAAGCVEPACAGATGRWVAQDEAPAGSVPEPAALALIGLGALAGAALGAMRRRRP